MEASMSFWKELSRRNVVKVGIAYAVAAWLIIHPVDIIFPILHLPEWSITLVAAFLIILFPLVLIFAWAYEVTPKGLKKTKDVPLSKSTTHVTGRKLNYIIIGLLVVAVGLLIFDNFYLDRRTVETKQVPVVGEVETAKKTIAVLPFEDLSPNSDQGYFVLGLSEEILNSLAQIPDLNVTGRTSSFSFKGSNKTAQEIANALGVDNILEGSVRKAGNALRITTQLLRGKDGFHLWSKTYDRELKDIFTIQEDIATAVASELKAALGVGKSLKQLGGTENIEAYELYLIALGQVNNDERNRALESLNSALKLDPEFALGWALKTNIHSSIAAREASSNSIPMEIEAAVAASQRAVELEPELPEAIIALGHTKTIEHEWIQAELNYRKAIELTSGGTSKNLDAQTKADLYMHYLAVGNFEKALDVILEVRLSDPLDPTVRALYITILGIKDDMRQAEDEDERCRALFGNRWDSYNWGITSLRLGAGEPISHNDIVYPSLIVDPLIIVQ